MSHATLSDPRVRAAQNKWYLYFSRDPAYGPNGCVRAVIEEVCDEIWNEDDGPTRARRKFYVIAEEVRDSPPQSALSEQATYDGLDRRIEYEMSDEKFQELIDDGTIIPISVP